MLCKRKQFRKNLTDGIYYHIIFVIYEKQAVIFDIFLN